MFSSLSVEIIFCNWAPRCRLYARSSLLRCCLRDSCTYDTSEPRIWRVIDTNTSSSVVLCKPQSATSYGSAQIHVSDQQQAMPMMGGCQARAAIDLFIATGGSLKEPKEPGCRCIGLSVRQAVHKRASILRNQLCTYSQQTRLVLSKWCSDSAPHRTADWV
jgi:hypothetical protein